jgi:hypothetical protein
VGIGLSIATIPDRPAEKGPAITNSRDVIGPAITNKRTGKGPAITKVLKADQE